MKSFGFIDFKKFLLKIFSSFSFFFIVEKCKVSTKKKKIHVTCKSNMGLPPSNTIVFINLPDNISIGIDTFYLNTGPTLRGIRLIPDGVHTLHWANTTGGSVIETSQRQGVFFGSQSKKSNVSTSSSSSLSTVYGCTWDSNDEALRVIPINETDINNNNNNNYGNNDGAFSYTRIQKEVSQWYEVMLTYEQLRSAQQGKRPKIEELVDNMNDDDESDEEEERNKNNNKKQTVEWNELTRHLSSQHGSFFSTTNTNTNTLARVLPEYTFSKNQTGISTMLYYVDTMMATKMDLEKLEEETRKASTNTSSKTNSKGPETTEPEPELRFIDIDLKKTWRPGAVGSQRTHDYLDKTWYFETILNGLKDVSSGDDNGSDGVNEWLAELELSFIVFTLYGNLSSAAQWRRMVTLMLQCEDYASSSLSSLSSSSSLSQEKEEISGKYFLQMLEVIYLQMLTIPQEYFTEVLGGDTYMKGMFGKLYRDLFTINPPEDRWFFNNDYETGGNIISNTEKEKRVTEEKIKQIVKKIATNVFKARFKISIDQVEEDDEEEEFQYRDWM